MKKSKMIYAGMIMLLCVASVGAAAQKADFSGTWTLDKSRSEGVPPDTEQTMTVKQTDDRVEIQTIISGAQGEQKISDHYVLDGKETDFTPNLMGGAQASAKGRRTSTRTADGNGFDVTERATIDGPDGEVEIEATRTWRLSPDGKTLTVELSMKSSQGSRTSKRVFVKK